MPIESWQILQQVVDNWREESTWTVGLEPQGDRERIGVAGPLAVAVVAALYLFSNIAYLAGASKGEIMASRRLVVALLMKNIWGEKVERWVDFGVAFSSLGSVLALVFAQGRINHELGKEGVLPWIANVFLFIAPLVKPPPGAEPYEVLPYWTHAAVGWTLFGVGGIWWGFKRLTEEESVA